MLPTAVSVRLLQEKNETVEKAVDCLRIVTTGNNINKRALVDIPIALPALIRLLEQPQKARLPRPAPLTGRPA